MGEHIFISYATKDALDFALKLHDELETAGYNAWLDKRDLKPGQNWDRAIEQAIRSAWGLVFVITPASLVSEVCQDEWGLALLLKIPVIPLKLQLDDDGQLPLRLVRRQYIDFMNRFDRGMAQLRERLKALQTEEAQTREESIRTEDAAEDVVAGGGGLGVIVAMRPDDIPYRPDKLIGRDDLRIKIRNRLERGEQLLLQGTGGAGKTALAATVAADWLAAGRGPALWLRAGSADSSTIFEALARPFGLHGRVAQADNDDKPAIVRDILSQSQLSLIVLDDAWNGAALNTVLGAIPGHLPVLITSRQRFTLNAIIEIPDLPLDKALELLRFHAGEYADDELSARELINRLGRLAFAVEVAGVTMRVQQLSALELLQRIADAPQTLAFPDEMSDEQKSISLLLETSLSALDDAAKSIFFAWGAFFAALITPEMMMLYYVGTPEVSADQLAAIREKFPDFNDLSDEEMIPLVQQAILQNTDATPAQNGLEKLVAHGLATRITQTEETVTYYRLHDLAFSYARSYTTPEQHRRALTACLNYMRHYNKPSLKNFAALRPEFDNFLGGARWALQEGFYSEVEQFSWGLYMGSEVLDYLGFYRLAIQFLQLAVEAADKRGDIRDKGAHLTHLGQCYSNLGQYEQALLYYQEALDIDRQTGNRKDEAADLGNMGNVLRNLGKIDEAIEYYEKQLTIGIEIEDRVSEGNAYGSMGLAYAEKQEYSKAIEYHERALAIARELGDRRAEANRIGNLGIAYRNMGHAQKAIEYYLQDLAIRREIGDKRGEANSLNNMGVAYEVLGDFDKAIELYQQAKQIYIQIDVPYLVEKSNTNIASAMRGRDAKALGTSVTPPPPTPVGDEETLRMLHQNLLKASSAILGTHTVSATTQTGTQTEAGERNQ